MDGPGGLGEGLGADLGPGSAAHQAARGLLPRLGPTSHPDRLRQRSSAILETSLHQAERTEADVQVMMFIGRDGWKATSLDPSGYNLPLEHSPWQRVRYRTATGLDERGNLQDRGFHVFPYLPEDDD